MILVGVAVLINLFVWRGLFSGKVPIPLDALIGVYHPWADHFWGFVAGVPYKNISLTDVFSQIFPWRVAAMNLIRSWQWPLWNPYSFAGYPLAGNWQSAPFNPFNSLMLLFGNVTGYGILVALQPVLAMIFMLLFLREIRFSKSASFVGAISFSFGGYMMTYLTWATTGYILAFLPLGLFFVEKFIMSNKWRYILGLSLSIYVILTGGFFQPAFFSLLTIAGYSLTAALTNKQGGRFLHIALGVIIGAGLAGIQLAPTLELLSLSIRNLDHNISEYNFGLLPLKSLLTLLAPDFFGNPATGNYFGPIQYQEASGYFGVVGLVLAIASFFSAKKNWRQIFFIILFLVSLALVFDWPIGRAVFDLKLPLLSTGYASRWLMLSAFAGSVLAAFGLEVAKNNKRVMTGFLTVVILTMIYFLVKSGRFGVDPAHISVVTRNLILPILIALAGLVCFFLPKRIGVVLICLLITFDLVRYTTKFTPMVPKEYGTTKNEFLQKLSTRAGINRVAIDQGPILPANTWMYDGIYTIGGYDPLLYKDYGIWFRALNVGVNPEQKIDGSLGKGGMTRYLNLDNPMSPLLDLAGVKYFLTLKKDKNGQFNSGGNINQDFLKKYSQVDDDGATVLLENKTAMGRFGLFYEAETEMNDVFAAERLVGGFDFRRKLLLKEEKPQKFAANKGDQTELVKYSANEVNIKAKTKDGAYLLLTDTDYPGWSATVNGAETKIIRADGIFRAVELPAGEVDVRFFYFPKSFQLGLATTIFSLVTALGISFIAISRKKF